MSSVKAGEQNLIFEDAFRSVDGSRSKARQPGATRARSSECTPSACAFCNGSPYLYSSWLCASRTQLPLDWLCGADQLSKLWRQHATQPISISVGRQDVRTFPPSP